MNNCKKMDKKCEYADRLGMCENITATCSRSRTMRLIDADALYKRIPAYVCVPCTFSKETEKDCKDCVVQRVMNIVDNFPTIDAVDVVHGHWEIVPDDNNTDGYYKMRCSVCGETLWSIQSEELYCCKCGAKMDEKEKEE